MIDEMTNSALIAHVIDSEDASEMERELAHRLSVAVEEIETIVEDLQRLKAQYGDGA